MGEVSHFLSTTYIYIYICDMSTNEDNRIIYNNTFIKCDIHLVFVFLFLKFLKIIYIFCYRGSPNIEMDEQTFLVNRERAVDYLNSLDKVT